jgi:hypothetical protein
LQALLAPALAPRAAAPLSGDRLYSFGGVGYEVSVVLSCLARLGDPGRAAEAFQRGVVHLQAQRARIGFLGEGECAMAAFGAAMLQLRALGLSLRRRLVLAALEVLDTDGKVSVEEAELFRAIAATLDFPVPMPA